MCVEVLWHCMMPRYHMFARVAHLLLSRPRPEPEALLAEAGARGCRWRPYDHGMASAEGPVLTAALARPAVHCPGEEMVGRYSYLRPARLGQCCVGRVDAAYRAIADECGHVHTAGSSLLTDLSAFTRLIYDEAMCARCAFSAAQHMQVEFCKNAPRISRGGVLTRKDEVDWWTRVLFTANGAMFRQMIRCAQEVGSLDTHRENGFEDFPCWSEAGVRGPSAHNSSPGET